MSVEVDLLRSGRSASQLRATLRQDGTRCVEALLTTSELDPAATPYWERGVPLPSLAPIGDCVRVPPRTPSGDEVALMRELELRLDPATLGFATGAPSGRGELRGWFALPGVDVLDPLALLVAVDCFPPATFDIAPSGWVPTLELTAYVRALPAPGPLRIRTQAGVVEGQRVDESCWVWDTRGRLVAQSVQLAGVRLG